MPINPLVLELLQQAAESGQSAEEVCKDRPELLDEVRSSLRRLASVRDELDALFPEEEEAGSMQTSASPTRPEIPGYSVGEILGRGGMGVVYKARHLRLNRPVAVKMMLNGGFAGPPELARFQREAEVLAALQHPNIVQVHDVGESGGLPYFTMEFIDGGNLAQMLAGTPQPARDAASLMVLLAGAVEAAHRGGIVHRDLKPANVLLTAGGTPKITDFGLARRFEAGDGLSMTGARIGTPGYMAPEQAAGQARVSGPATDVYALGAILYEMLTGRPPFLAETAAETERQVIAEDPASPSRLNAKVPRDLETICLKCLQKEARRRYASAADLAADLGRFLRGEPIAARPVCSIERASKWIRRHPTRTVTLFGGVTIAAAILIAGWWFISERSLTAHAAEEDLRVATQSLRRSDWGEARSALERARGRLGLGEYGDLRRRLDQAGRDQDLVGQLAAIRLDRISRSENERGEASWSGVYEKSFRADGLLDLDASPRVAADRLGNSEIKDALVAAIDDWALCASFVPDAQREAWLLEVARKTDPDPRGWRDRFRNPTVRRDKQELSRLAASARIAETPVNLLVSLGELLQKLEGDAIPFLRSVQQLHPDDLWVNYLLGIHALNRDDLPEALRNLQAALATRPETAFLNHYLGEALIRGGRCPEAIPYCEKAVQLEPRDSIMRSHLGICLFETDRVAEATEQFERALEHGGDAAARSSIRSHLRRCYSQLGKIQEFDTSWRDSLENEPAEHEDWDGYAEFCLYHGREDEYRKTCRGLIEHFSETQDIRIAERTGRACLLLPVSGEVLEKATALIDRALAEKKPDPPWLSFYFLVAKGLAEYRHDRLESAISIMDGPASPALQPVPRLVSAMARYRLGRREEAIKLLAEAMLLADWRKSRGEDREQWIYHILRREAEAMLLPDLRAFLEGRYQPRNRDEKVCFLGVCQSESWNKATADLYKEILASETSVAEDLHAGNRYRAACAAALAGSGLGKDAGSLDEAERLRWRKQARDWLRADLELARKLSKTNTSWFPDFLKNFLKSWLTDPDLSGLRDLGVCKELSPTEQQEFQALCDGLQSLTRETRK